MTEPSPPELPDPLDHAAGRIGGRPGSSRWEIVTALFGWTAVFAFPAWFIASWLGSGEMAAWLFGLASGALGIALKRDLLKLLLTGRSGWGG